MSDIDLTVQAGPTVELTADAPGAVTVTVTSGGGVTDHGALTGLADDDHPQYVAKSLVDAAGDLLVGSAADTVARLPMGAALQTLRVNAGATGLEYAAPAGLDAPWTQSIDLRATPYAQTNMSTLVPDGGTVLYDYARIDSGTPGAASVSYKVPMSAGTYSLEIVAYADTYMPIVTAKIDGTTVGTVDFYKTGGIVQREGAITGLTVATSGTKTINLTNATKNASSSGYTFYLMALRILRTA